MLLQYIICTFHAVTTDEGASIEDELEAQLAALSLQQEHRVPLSTPEVSQPAKKQTPMLA